VTETSPQHWPVVLSAAAERDFTEVLAWTAEHFGTRQAEAYQASLGALLFALAEGPDHLNARARDEIGAGLRSLHLRGIGERGSHFVLFRSVGREIQVLRILHDRMDLARHVPEGDG
jgi:toxin ParE1/3/4